MAINDTLGHKAGDEMLKHVAARLKSLCRESDIIARIGGDEFLIILPNLEKRGGAVSVAEKVIEAVSQPANITGQECSIGVSIGISIYPQDGESLDDLIKKADMAMYSAKEYEKGGYRFFSET